MVSQTGSQSKREKAAKGSVQVKAVKGRLRLVWSFQGQRYFLSLETEDSALSRKVAEAKAKLIESDVLTGNFDPSLDKYKPETQRKSSILVPELMDSFLKQKAKQVSKRTMEKYRAFGTHPQRFFKNKAAVEVGEPQADKFRVDLLSRELDPATIKAILGFCGSCWEWAMSRQVVANSPWAEVQKRVKVPPKQKPKPFTKEEIGKIITGFRNHPNFNHYTEFVEFRLDTGCRIAEAAGLKFKHVSDDCASVARRNLQSNLD